MGMIFKKQADGTYAFGAEAPDGTFQELEPSADDTVKLLKRESDGSYEISFGPGCVGKEKPEAEGELEQEETENNHGKRSL